MDCDTFKVKKSKLPLLDIVKFLAGIGPITDNFEIVGNKHLLCNDAVNEDCGGKRRRTYYHSIMTIPSPPSPEI